MSNDQAPAATDTPAPTIELDVWINDIRNRTAAAETLARARPRRPLRRIPKWVLAPILCAAIGLGWLAWSSASSARGEVQGRVQDIHGQPVTDALVFLVADPTVETRTNSDGSFCMAGVPLGKQTLLIAQEGMGEVFTVRVHRDVETNLGDLVFRVPPMSARRAPGGGAYWGKK